MAAFFSQNTEFIRRINSELSIKTPDRVQLSGTDVTMAYLGKPKYITEF